MKTIKGKYTTAFLTIDTFDKNTLGQIEKMTNHCAFTNPITIMPDGHAGTGSCIGFTMKLGDKIIPNIVGVDIGCGVDAYCLGDCNNFNKEKLVQIEKDIKNLIPIGFTCCSKKTAREIGYENNDVEALCKKIELGYGRVKRAIGTLGGGNHFIEIGKDSNNNIWLLIHTGSRNFGFKVCNYHIEKAIKKTEMGELSYLKGDDAKEYLEDMRIAQKYAQKNRDTIAKRICENIFKLDFDTIYKNRINTVHNYIGDDNIIRKGAISSYANEKILVPMNMQYGTFICIGKGNKEWNYSAPHGAGRQLSRTMAKKTINIENFIEQMKNIVSTSVAEKTLDEAPDAYKNPDIIKKAISPTAKIIDLIEPLINIKG